MGGRHFLASVVAAAVGLFVLVPAAEASFHLIKVREVFPGTAAHPDSGYVELQMFASGQNLVNFGQLEVFNSTGTVTNTFTPGSSVAKSENQRTVLIADSEYSSQFPAVPPDFTDAGLNLNPGGGAVCWPQTEPPYDDCASWGNFAGQASLPSPGDASPAAPLGITDGMAVRRSISANCSTLLENADDTNNSSADFSLQTPNPRDNASPIAETECPSLPNTAIKEPKPANPTKETSAHFTYEAIPAAGASFECELGGAVFSSCPAAGIEYTGLVEGIYTFEVRAVNGSGADSTPATYTWKVDTTAPTATIDTHPEDPSSGASVSFTFHSSETGSTFACSLGEGAGSEAFSACSSGKTYTNLENGSYTFKVRATDKAGNQGPSAEFAWEVNNSLADTTPPETTIVSKPPDPSESPTASFTYESNEPGSSFECELDGAPFASCPAAGIAYTGLAAGPHAFQVRAIDPSGNVDPTPAGYSFDVVAAPSMGPGQPRTMLPPETRILAGPHARTRDRTPTFRFASSAAGAAFQCSVDHSPFRSCRSPFTTRRLRLGRHLVRIRAVAAGLVDETPAVSRFRVVRRHRGRRRGR